MVRRDGNCTVRPRDRRRVAIQLLLALLGLVLGLSLMIWLASAQGGSVVLGGMNGVVLGGVLGAILAGQVDRWMPPSR